MHCAYFESERCRSCAWIGLDYPEQLVRKQARCRLRLAEWPGIGWLAPVASAERGFRNKAKMVVGGSIDAPTLGILDADGTGVDLQACPLYPPPLEAAFPAIARFITEARVPPYDVAGRRGELKHVIATVAEPGGELMLRFVLRSTEALQRIRKHLPALQAALPNLRVASVNLQPVHKAVLEGEQEILMTAQESLPMQVNELVLHLRPRSFFQTNTAVAAALYAQARDWVAQCAPTSVWDLYCGVGGFALHCAAPGRQLTGVEASSEAVASAARSRDAAGWPAEGSDAVRFVAADALEFARAARQWPDLVVVNPPRRGLGPELAAELQRARPPAVLYSSCNVDSLVRDLHAMPALRPAAARLFDMFPHTAHYELAVLLHPKTPPVPTRSEHP